MPRNFSILRLLSAMSMTQAPSTPLPPEEPKVGSTIVGAKLSWNEYAMAWATVVILTLGNLLSSVGNFVVAYFFTQVASSAWRSLYSNGNHPCTSSCGTAAN